MCIMLEAPCTLGYECGTSFVVKNTLLLCFRYTIMSSSSSVAHVGSSREICHRWAFYFSFLSPPHGIIDWYSLFFFYISTLIPFLLISYFYLWSFWKSFLSFQFSPSILICHIFVFFLIWSLFFLFLFFFLFIL
jgi:hypothetical protein